MQQQEGERKAAPLAQLVEQLTLNQRVLGSSPRWCTTPGGEKKETWLVGQAVKTPASHAGNAGSIPARVTTFSVFLFLQVHMAGVYDGEDPPVPIPNTEVKLTRADNTWREAAW